MYFNTRPYRPLTAVATATIAMLLTVSAAAEETAAGFEMAVIQDVAYGTEIVAGNFRAAILGINSERSRAEDAFATRNNLCVALTMNSKFEKALPECNEAIAISVERLKVQKRFGYIAGTRNLAIALSNRGVLRLLIGETELARDDFHEARMLRAGVAAPRRNLQYLAAKAEAHQAALLE